MITPGRLRRVAAHSPDTPPCATGRPAAAGARRTVVGALLAGIVLAGCASTPPATSGGGAPGPLPQAPSGARPDKDLSGAGPAAAPSEGAHSVELPWPAPTAAAAAALQGEVDRGAQPWLLDPSEVAIAYAAAAHDWPDAEAYPGPDGTSVDVRNAEGERLTLSLAQPARTGDDGIWVVTTERR